MPTENSNQFPPPSQRKESYEFIKLKQRQKPEERRDCEYSILNSLTKNTDSGLHFNYSYSMNANKQLSVT